MKAYKLFSNENDPSITIKVPSEILKDLVLRSEENGSTVEVEFARRLARSLEKDIEMINLDNQLAYELFNSNGE